VTAPTLEAVFVRFPLGTFPRGGSAGYLSGWSHDGWTLYNCDSYTDFYDERWRDPDAAFTFWLDVSRRSRVYRQLPREEGRHFRSLFEAEFAIQLGGLFESDLQRAYDHGFDDGWGYGAFIHEELDYRQGYHEGFQEAATDAALAGFRGAYPVSYERAYEASFADWSRNAKPEIGEVLMKDEDGDGVFQPGEAVRVEYELINYGGGEARLPLSLRGQVLADTVRVDVRLPARSVIVEERPLLARISPATPTRTRTQVELRLGDRYTELPLSVSYPLQLVRRSVTSYRDNLAGEVIVEIDVENQSTRTIDGTIEIATSAKPGFREVRAVDRLGGRGGSAVSFAVTALDPLALMGGDVSLTFSAVSGGLVQDSFTYHLPDAARDLASRDLLLYMLEMARDPRTTRAEIATARDLMLVRLREDWKVAAMRRGNPYKRDYKRNATETALGDLVHSYQAQGSRLSRPETFSGLSAEIAELADVLPGRHPFLRKYMRRLASQLP
jgi:hypothetical protein